VGARRSPKTVTSVVSLVVSRNRTAGLGEIGGDRATGKSGGGRSIWREDRTTRVDRVSGDWTTRTTWDRGRNSGVGSWSLTTDADESGARLSGNDWWVLRLRSISGSWTIWNRTGGRWATRLWEPGRDLSVGRGEIGGGRTGGNSGIGVNWVVTASGVGIWVGAVRFVVGNWNIRGRTGGLWEISRWWTTGLREPSGDGSTRRGEISGGWSRGNSRIRVVWVVAASGVLVRVGSIRFVVGNWDIWDWATRLRKSGRWWTARLREPSGDRSTRRGEIGGRRTGGDRKLRWGCVIAATVARVGVVGLIRNIWDRASGLGESGWGWTTGIGEPSGRRSIWRGERAIRRGHIGGDWPARNSQSSWNRSVLVRDGRDGH
jgi:hypothetical protein